MLPLATPAYVVAYVYTDLLEFAGPVQSTLRAVTGWEPGDYVFPPIRSLGGAALMLSLVLYPYVYLLARTAFETQAASLVDAARVLGAGSTRAFYTIALPASRPVVAGGVALAMMETVADYGVVDYFGVSTFTTGIFRTWFALGDRVAAVQLAGWLFIVVAALIVAEQWARRGGHANPVMGTAAITPSRLKGLRAWLATGVCALPLMLGLVVPMVVLARYAVFNGDPLLGRGFQRLRNHELRCGRHGGGARNRAGAPARLQQPPGPAPGQPRGAAYRDAGLRAAGRRAGRLGFWHR